ncbi:nucleotide exchange factor SIL1 [Plectosphaerella cucumerina]|uniref:Nucleotide exchange factor SIL1 n=1 Tax=Plectosphaerella cucumerina TaxID=40658 RepID=A0A8K0TGY6_9PEZI|nr:nucleotide exchange factor SIL1 [Plectosphaerella cucumerina]
MSRSKSPARAFGPVLLILALFALALFVPKSHASPEEPSPAAEVELICHTDNPAECYPKVFEATHEFQVVHDDQVIPNGLHIRLDVTTGVKTAKINYPDEKNPELEGLPVDKAVVTVEGAEAEDEPLFLKGAPVYEMFGKVKPPQEESGEFYSNLDYVRKGPGGSDLPFDEALEFLEDIAHDIYYGGKIAETPATVKALLCLMVEPDGTVPEGVKPRGQQAASIVAAALRNNPSAAENVGAAWTSMMDSTCADKLPLRQALYGSFSPQGALTESDVPVAAARAKAHVAAFSSLLRNADVRRDFLAHGGMTRLAETLMPTVPAWDAVQRKVGNLLLDNFLDEELGAATGEWPTFRAAEADKEKRAAARAADEVWLTALRDVKDRNSAKKSHWSVDVLRRLEALHQKQLKALPKEEL